MREENVEKEEIIRRLNNERKEKYENEIRERFTRFWNWYQTITSTQSHEEETKEHFTKLLLLGNEITDRSNKEINRLLNKLITSI